MTLLQNLPPRPAPMKVDLTSLPTGYYRVRRGNHWMVARWKPAVGHWASTTRIFDPYYFTEIAEKVA